MQAAISTSNDAPRFDLYRPIHKALRAFMSDTLVAVGSLDIDDEADVTVVVDQTRGLLAMLAVHLDDENRFVHAAMEARRPGSARRTADDHVSHECALADLEHLLVTLERSDGAPTRAQAAFELYRRLGLFVAENYEHMNVEERENNAVLWADYADEELVAIEGEILGSIPPEALAVGMRWMIPAINHGERVGMLQGMRAGMPPETFEGVLAIARAHLAARDWAKLESALGLGSELAA